MQKITIDGTDYEVKDLTPADGWNYRHFLDELAIKELNPYRACFEKVKDLPEKLQEIVFAKLPASIFPLTAADLRCLTAYPAAVQLLFDLATVDTLSSDVVTLSNCLDVQRQLMDAIGPSLLVKMEPLGGDDEPVGPSPKMEAMLSGILAGAREKKATAEKATDDTDKTEEEMSESLDEIERILDDPPPLPGEESKGRISDHGLRDEGGIIEGPLSWRDGTEKPLGAYDG